MTMAQTTRTLAVLTALVFVHLNTQSQILLQSGFEAWNAGLPMGFGGVHTTLPMDSVVQVNDPVHGGTKALALRVGDSGSGLLTTTSLEVVAYQFYEVRFWVRGQGRISAGLYDGRTEHDGFAPGNSAIVVNDTAWQYVMQTVMATRTTADAEFVLTAEAQGTASRVVVDDFLINVSDLPIPTPTTIRTIQETNDFSGTSPLHYQFVRTQGIITARSPNSVFIQDGSGPWSGLEVRYTPPADWALGDSLRVVGTVAELGGEQDPWLGTRTQLISIRNVEVSATGNPLPAPAFVVAGDLHAEHWESVLVQVPDLECINAPDPFEGHWPTTNASDTIMVDDLLYPYFPTIGAVYTITGIAHFTGTTVLLPRIDADIERYTSIVEHAPNTLTVFPNPASDRTTVQLSTLNGDRTIRLIDMTGRFTWATRLAPGQQEIDLSDIPNGQYLVSILEGGRKMAARLVVRH